MTQDELVHRPKQWSFIGVAAALTLPALVVKFVVLGAHEHPNPLETAAFGLAILGAAFLLSWGAEVAQLDISQGLALAFLAFIAVLPEYAVDLVFAWKAGADDALGALTCTDPCAAVEPANRQLAIANMTGANRLLIGLGLAGRRADLRGDGAARSRWRCSSSAAALELGFLRLATLATRSSSRSGAIVLVDSVVLVGALRRLHRRHIARRRRRGPRADRAAARRSAALGARAGGCVTIGMFVFAALVILVAPSRSPRGWSRPASNSASTSSCSCSGSRRSRRRRPRSSSRSCSRWRA